MGWWRRVVGRISGSGQGGFAVLQGVILADRYQVGAKLGAGGMGSVYLARDVRLDRDVVVKVPHLKLLDDHSFRRRFAQEVRSLVRFPNPHIVKVFDFGTVKPKGDEIPFLVVEYLPGGDLEELLDEQKTQPPQDAARWLRTIASALDAMHAADFVHRDVKPGNILFDDYGNAYLSDFGIAKALGQSNEPATTPGFVVGSPAFMAPEQFSGVAVPASDQYALATSVYRAVSGRNPFPQQDANDMRRAKLEGGLPSLEPRIPSACDQAVARALDPDPDKRFGACGEFAEVFASGLADANLRRQVSPVQRRVAEGTANVSEAAVEAADVYRRRKRTSVLAILFSDIVDSTRLIEELGGVRYEELRDEYDALLDSIVGRNEDGSVVDRAGDGALAVFSEPSTAVLRALEVQAALREHKYLRLRIGIDMGQVSQEVTGGIVRRVLGRHVNRAARVQNLAEPGHVLTTFQVYDSAVGWLKDEGVDWVSHGESPPLKGFSSPVSVYEPFDPRVGRPQAPTWIHTNTNYYLLPGDRGSTATRIGGPPPASVETRKKLYRARKARSAQETSAEDLLVELENARVGALPPPAMTPPDGPIRARSRGSRYVDPSLQHFVQKIRQLSKDSSRRLTGSGVRRGAISSPRILWVDDYPQNNERWSALLQRAGCIVESTLNTAEAIALLERAEYDCVISDMGRGDDSAAGLTILRAMRPAFAEVPLIIFSTRAAIMEYGPEAMRLGAFSCGYGAVSLFENVYRVLASR